MANITHKQVVIPSVGPIYPKGSVNGPITTPYREDVQTISLLLMRGYKVTEVLPGDVRVELTLSNYDKDNSPQEGPTAEELAAEAQRIAEEEEAQRLAEEAEKERLAEEARQAEEAKQAQIRVQQQNQKNNKHQQKNRPQPDELTQK